MGALLSRMQMRCVVLLLFGTFCVSAKTWRVGMPKEDVPKADTYRCIISKAPTAIGSITDVQAFPSNRHTVHHALLFVCADVLEYFQKFVDSGKSFPCMDGSNLGSVCTKQMKQMYGYDNMQVDDPQALAPLKYPDGVGILVGQRSPYKYGMLQVHNNHPTANEDTHFDMTIRDDVVMPNKVFIEQLTPDDFVIPPGKSNYDVHIEKFTVPYPLHIWGFHSHFHAIGSEVHAQVYHGSELKLRYDFVKGVTPSPTHQIPEPLKLSKGDRIEGFCRYNSTLRSYATPSGAMHSTTEMCNIGIMVFVPTSEHEIMVARAAISEEAA